MLLRAGQIAQQRCQRPGRQRTLFGAAHGFPVIAKLPAQHLFTVGRLIFGVGQKLGAAMQMLAHIIAHGLLIQHGFVHQHLAGPKAAQLGDDGFLQLFRCQLGGADIARGNIGKADARTASLFAFAENAGDIVVAVVLQHTAFDHGAGRNYADDIALHQPLCLRGQLGLLADGHLVALGDQAGHIGFIGMKGHAAHGGALFHAALLAGEGEFQFPGCS